jgi:hypothetical protein
MEGKSLTDEQFNKFLECVATKWSTSSDSYLATITIEGCTILFENFEFIEIFPNVI